jgi:hypothetical protein
MVVDASSFWYGSYYDRSDNKYTQVTDPQDSHNNPGFTVSWKNVIVPPKGTAYLSLVFRWGGDQTTTPVLTISSAPLLADNVSVDEPITLTGSASDQNDADNYHGERRPFGSGRWELHSLVP